jgi:hypothetical protein
MRDPDSFPRCSICLDVVIYCKCIEKHNNEMMERFQNGKQCPECLSKDSIGKIQYGYPGNKMIDQADKGKIILGGCSISDKNPDYQCGNCKYQWQSKKPHSGSYANSD